MTANVGTVQWMAPEVLIGNAYDESVDIFSMALVSFTIISSFL
jgi:serine/threonine protein kinase